jgi:hypothetical protein
MINWQPGNEQVLLKERLWVCGDDGFSNGWGKIGRGPWEDVVLMRLSALALAFGLWLCAPSLASAAVEHPFIEDFGSANKPTFAEAQGMAVDQATGDLLVIDRVAQTLSRWNPDGTPADFSALGSNVIGGFDFASGGLRNPGEVEVAVDSACALHEPPLTELSSPTCEEFDPANGDIYVAERGASRIDIFDEKGNFLGELTQYDNGSIETFGVTCGVAVDPSGNVYVDDASNEIHKYEPAANPPVNGDNSPANNFPFPFNCNIAAGIGPSAGFIFPVQFNGKISKLESTAPGAEKYEVDSGPTTTAAVDPSSSALFTASGSEVKEFDATGETEAIPGTSIAPGGEKVTGVAVNRNGEIYVARKGSSHIEVWGPAGQLPVVFTEAASVIGGSVTLNGVVNANGGSPASCIFQYIDVNKAKGFEGATSVLTTPGGPFEGTANQSVSAEVGGLAEGIFRFRLLCTNEDGSKAGETLFFDTLEATQLPDGRSYEMVSPSQKAGEVIPPEPSGALTGSCGNCLPGENAQTMPMQSAPDGESVLYLGQPFSAGLASGPNEYLASRISTGWGTQSLSPLLSADKFVAFSADLSRSVLLQANPPLTPEAPTRAGKAFQNLYFLESGELQPLVSEEPPHRSPGEFRIQFGNANGGTQLVQPFSHLVFAANDALTGASEDAPEAPEVEAGGGCTEPGTNCNLYEWVDGHLALINVLPGNKSAATGAVLGSGNLLPIGEADFRTPDVDHAISNDGSRIFWSAGGTGHLYVRINSEETLEFPDPGSCKESVPLEERACFLTASPEGSLVLFSDGQLYELNGAGTAYEKTSDLTEGQGGFRGILGAAEDLSHIYFVDTKALTGSEQNGNEEHAETGEFNLYSWDEGSLTFIGILSSGDNNFTSRGYGAWTSSPSHRTAQVSSDGRYLAFMSLAQLTGYDNNLRGGGNCTNLESACREVFVYSADSQSLSCASCNPTGQQPLGRSNLTLLRPDARPFPQPGNLSRDGGGRLFFESQDTLSARDINGRIQDIYEWEPNGVGSCNRSGGCVYLVSSGSSPNDSMFLDSSATGRDAFLITRQQLLPRDKDQQLDLYDARIGGGFLETGVAPCSPEACAGPLGSPPAPSSTGSAAFNGPSNPKPKPTCKPGFVKKHGTCVKKKHKKHKKHNHGGSR